MTQSSGLISVVVPVLDDLEGMRELLEALDAQTRLPDECVVVDGGSTDGTARLLAEWQGRFPLRIVSHPGRNIAAARNIGIETAQFEWIACTDAGCRPARDWLAAIERARASSQFVAGVTEIERLTGLERALAVTHYPVAEELDAPPAWIRISHRLFGRGYVPDRTGGGNMAFSKAVWRAVGGFPEGVYAGEDRALTSAVVRAGFRATRSPDVVVSWRPPGSWIANARMFYTYSRGDVRFPGRTRHAVRFAAWAVALRAMRAGSWGRLMIVLGGLGYAALPMHRAWRARLPARVWWRIPALIATKDIAQMAGALTGLLDACVGRPQPPPRRRHR